MSKDELVEHVTEAVDSLIEPTVSRVMFGPTEARLQGRSVHVTRVPSLLDQLRADLARSGNDDAGGAYASSPALRTDVLDVLLRIERESSRWAWQRLDLDLRDSVEANLRALVGAATTADTPTLRDLAHDAAHWVRLARIVCGWDSPPFRPNAPCPHCDGRGLRIYLAGRTATCLECGATWTPDTIGLLAEHVRYCNGDQDEDEADRADVPEEDAA